MRRRVTREVRKGEGERRRIYEVFEGGRGRKGGKKCRVRRKVRGERWLV